MSRCIGMLRRHKLALLLDDLCARVRREIEGWGAGDVPGAGALGALLQTIEDASAELLGDPPDEGALRASVRGLLWDLRLELEPLGPPQALRTSLEVARTGFLDIPGRNGGGNSDADDGDGEADEGDNSVAVMRSEMYALMVENVLLEELRSLRILERQLRAAVLAHYPGEALLQLRNASSASASLGIDDYRVRGKMRLTDAVSGLRVALQAQVPGGQLLAPVHSAADILHNALVTSLQTDLSVRRPAGRAMLLRPRMHDIPNFEVVTPGILRGGQPTSLGLDWLANYGVSLIIDLRGSDRENQWEMPTCRILPPHAPVHGEDHSANPPPLLMSCSLPIEDFCTPTFEQVEEFIQLIDSTVKRGHVSFVHCKAGIGRTGTLIACWRIYRGELVDDALSKERLYSPDGGGLRQEQFVRDYAALISSSSSEAAPSSSTKQ